MVNVSKLPVFCILCLLIFASSLYRQDFLAAAELLSGVVATCFDGDTVKLTDRRVIRLAGIDSPELHNGNEEPQYYAREAQKELTSLVRGKEIRMISVDEGEKDRYGRILADVILPDGRSLNDIMVSAGAAYVYPHKNLNEKFVERLHKLQHKAIIERRGMWAHILAIPAAYRAYVGNRQSRRFFPAESVFVQHIKPRNRVVFGTLMDAFTAGYAPARPCIFWPTVNAKPHRHNKER